MGSSVLSVDGGGTKTAALVATKAGAVQILTPAQGCNQQDGNGWDDALGAVLGQAKEIDFAVIGIPGFGEIPKHDHLVADFIATKIKAPHLIINDVELAFHGAFPSSDGVLLLAGTGSMAVGRTRGVMRRVGGWGHVLGDEGSAYWIGQRALSFAASETDGRRSQDGFAERLTAKMDTPKHLFGLLDWTLQNGESRARIASLARIVDDMALSGDPVAQAILDAAADELLTLANAASDDPTNWAHAGSVFKSEGLKAAVTKKLGPPVTPVANALVGGLHRAATLANWPIADDWINHVAAHQMNIE
ncbi:MAG: BadF/BadG/BcrA/BcrD ATPase family protein [Pseudoruegeria sp.]